MNVSNMCVCVFAFQVFKCEYTFWKCVCVCVCVCVKGVLHCVYSISLQVCVFDSLPCWWDIYILYIYIYKKNTCILRHFVLYSGSTRCSAAPIPEFSPCPHVCTEQVSQSCNLPPQSPKQQLRTALKSPHDEEFSLRDTLQKTVKESEGKKVSNYMSHSVPRLQKKANVQIASSPAEERPAHKPMITRPLWASIRAVTLAVSAP